MRTNSLMWSLLIASASAAITGRGENWPEFRGPTGQGLSQAHHVPVEWRYEPGGSSRNIAWELAIPGQGWSSPILQKGRLYLTTAVSAEENSELSLHALCIDAGTGKIVWDTAVFGRAELTRIHNKNSHASATPILDGQRLYTHFGHQGTACLDLNGQVLWRNTSLKYSPVHGNGGSPILAGDRLIFSCEGASDPFVVALKTTTGDVLWKTDRESEAKKKFSFSTPLLITVHGEKQVISQGSGVVCAYDPRDGREIWRVRYAEGYSIVPRPVYGQGLLFISTGFDHPIVMAIRPDGKGDVTETHVAWSTNRGAPNTPSLLLVDSELYLVSDAGVASCLDAKTGEEHWQERVGGNYSASPLHADGRIYLQSEDGTTVVLRAARTFQKLASNSLGERTFASYAVDDGALFIRGEKHLFKVQEPR